MKRQVHTMKAGTITAKLRDAVPVCFYENGSEVTRYRNIDIPDSLKELEIKDFAFNIAQDVKITFRLHFDSGILPAVFPPAREKMTRAEKAAAKAAETVDTAELAAAVEAILAEGGREATSTPADTEEFTDALAIPEYRFDVTGDRRKALVTAIRDFTSDEPIYKGAPSYAYMVGNYLIDRAGMLTGEVTPELLAALAKQGFFPTDSDAA